MTLPNNRYVVNVFRAIGMALALSSISHNALATDIERHPCGKLYEPSGVTQLLDGRLLVVEDEKTNPVRLLTNERDGAFSIIPLQTASVTSSGRSNLGVLADLEAVAIDNDGFVYAITSYSLTRKGKRSTAREKLVRFKVEGNSVSDVGGYVRP